VLPRLAALQDKRRVENARSEAPERFRGMTIAEAQKAGTAARYEALEKSSATLAQLTTSHQASM